MINCYKKVLRNDDLYKQFKLLVLMITPFNTIHYRTKNQDNSLNNHSANFEKKVEEHKNKDYPDRNENEWLFILLPLKCDTIEIDKRNVIGDNR